MNLKKWSPLRTSHTDAFREMEERHDSLLLPPERREPALPEQKPSERPPVGNLERIPPAKPDPKR